MCVHSFIQICTEHVLSVRHYARKRDTALILLESVIQSKLQVLLIKL